AASFGLPLPEEVVLVSAGLLCYMGSTSEPPEPGLKPLNLHLTAVICFFAVFLADFFVFSLGRKFGSKLLKRKFLSRYQKSIEKVMRWTEKYGIWAAGIFRFTPGIRFPGHFSCGTLGLAPWKFVLIDGMAALVSVPSQVYLVAFYGEEILGSFRKFKMVVFSILAVILLIYIIRKLWFRSVSDCAAGESCEK
ncbi:MAG: DedA family protein, partial [Oligoflexales bacterium]|nr:DedA family protein [Oligoflexales bacterium]